MASLASKIPLSDYYDLGDFHRPITTKSKEAQVWFNRGLIWTYGFNHQEAAECFQQAIFNDPHCAMAFWGLAYCLGPNYNKPWEIFDQVELEQTLRRIRQAATKAKELAPSTTPTERLLIDAIQNRYPEGDAGDARDNESYCNWNKAYANGMRLAYQAYPDDLDVATLYADALMNITPWSLWDLSTGEPAKGAHTLEAKTIFDRAFSEAENDAIRHPGLLHLYIHCMEMSSTPEVALSAADNLRGLVPDAGHLQHMPTHLDILCGDYRRAIASNSEAIKADEKFLARAGPMNFYTLYRCHDYHFRIYAAMLGGHLKVALQTVSRLEASLPTSLLAVTSPPMADWLEAFLTVRIHVLIRFGQWEDVIDLEFPSDRNLFCVTYAMMCYAKGVALAVTGRIEEAIPMRTQYHAAVKLVKPSRTLFNNTCIDILAVGNAMLDGELEFRKGENYDLAYEKLREAIRLEDSLPYDEPWGWMQPSRHAYGALLLERGYVEEAKKIYCADLGFDDSLPRAVQHPNNVWALHGYHECLVKLGEAVEARIIEKQLRLALAVADVPITSSCFCRRRVA